VLDGGLRLAREESPRVPAPPRRHELTRTVRFGAMPYAPVNDLDMYYEIHGEGRPTLLLPGAYMTTESMEPLLAPLAKTRQVIAVDPQGHGRTADIDRPITYEGMADDMAGLVRHLELDEIDVVGYSMGGGIGLQMAISHADLVRRAALASASFRYDGMYSEVIEMFPSITPEMFMGTPMEAEYKRLAPNPDDFPNLVLKLKALDTTPFSWDISGVKAPVLLVVGDSDIIRLEHAVEMVRLLGGGVPGDMSGPGRSQLAVLPGTTHFMPSGSGVMDRADLVAPMIASFLDASRG
jgi:pimeloyl-ACP methyl ester carboxylesterase